MSSIIQLAESFDLTEDGILKGSTNAAHRNYTPQRAKAVAEAAELWKKAWGGDKMAALVVNEAISTSDLFKSATGDVLDRLLLASYAEQPKVWDKFATRVQVRNFKPKKMVDIMGGRNRLDLVPELTEYPGADTASKEYSIAAKKFGRRFGYSWEAGVNDDIDELRRIPDAFASAARITEEFAALEAVTVPVTGAPSAAFFKAYAADASYSAFDNSGTAALTGDALTTALTAMAGRKDAQGNTVPRQRLTLMVGTALQFVAQRILNATTIRTTNGSKTTEEPNYLAGAVDLVVNPYLAGTAWYLLPTPSTNRPAVAVAFLSGYESPDLRIKSDTGSRVGGGSIAPTEGDFDIDAVYYRVRHVVGGANLDPISTCGSTGATGTPGI